MLPALHGNWVDLLLLIFLAGYALSGLTRGFISLLVEMGAFLGSFLLSLRFYPQAAKLLVDNFTLPLGVANALGFLILAFASEILLGLILAKLVSRLPQKFLASRANSLLGLIPGLIDGLILVAFFASLLISLPAPGGLKFAILHSKIGGAILTQTAKTENALTGVFGGAIEETLNFLTIHPQSRESVNLHFTASDFSTDPQAEAEMLGYLNAKRTENHLPALRADVSLTAVARAHSRDMLSRGYFSHYTPEGQSPFDRMRAASIKFTAAGENIAYAPTTSLADDGLWNSPEHRDNMLSGDYTRVGIGVIDGGIFGKMFTQDFAN